MPYYRMGGGTDTSDATATASNILSGKTAYVNDNKITGTMTNRSSITIDATSTSDDNYIYASVPQSGYYNTTSKLRMEKKAPKINKLYTYFSYNLPKYVLENYIYFDTQLLFKKVKISNAASSIEVTVYASTDNSNWTVISKSSDGYYNFNNYRYIKIKYTYDATFKSTYEYGSIEFIENFTWD